MWVSCLVRYTDYYMIYAYGVLNPLFQNKVNLQNEEIKEYVRKYEQLQGAKSRHNK